MREKRQKQWSYQAEKKSCTLPFSEFECSTPVFLSQLRKIRDGKKGRTKNLRKHTSNKKIFLASSSSTFLFSRTDRFKALVPQNKTIGKFYVVRKCRSVDLEAVKLWNARSGLYFRGRGEGLDNNTFEISEKNIVSLIWECTMQTQKIRLGKASSRFCMIFSFVCRQSENSFSSINFLKRSKVRPEGKLFFSGSGFGNFLTAINKEKKFALVLNEDFVLKGAQNIRRMKIIFMSALYPTRPFTILEPQNQLRRSANFMMLRSVVRRTMELQTSERIGRVDRYLFFPRISPAFLWTTSFIAFFVKHRPNSTISTL